jgi:hypothetical protein
MEGKREAGRKRAHFPPYNVAFLASGSVSRQLPAGAL